MKNQRLSTERSEAVYREPIR